MVSAELSHNPYLLETKALFNGHKPQPNSAIHKYEHTPLVDWVEVVPQIFHDEMNGYDFDFMFSGTDEDFMAVKDAFEMAGVPESSVRMIRKGVLDGPPEKLDGIFNLIRWLGESRNPHLELDTLFRENNALVDTSFTLIELYGEPSTKAGPNVSVEHYDRPQSFDRANLANTPILVNVDPQSVRLLSQDLRHLLSRDDVTGRQLFFVIHKTLSVPRVTRVLIDLGVRKPQVVRSIEDGEINRYIRGHQMSEYIQNVIRIMDAEIGRIEREVKEDRTSQHRSGVIKDEKIATLDDEISRLKFIYLLLSQLPTIEQPREFSQYRQQLEEAILCWWGHKQRLEGESQGTILASDLNRTVQQLIETLHSSLVDSTIEAQKRINFELSETYAQAGIDESFRLCASPISFAETPRMPDLTDKLLELNEKGNTTIYHLDAWRTIAYKMVEPTLDVMETAYALTLLEYQQWAINAYQVHITELVDSRKNAIEQMLNSLSADERAIRSQDEWLITLKEKVQEIGRG